MPRDATRDDSTSSGGTHVIVLAVPLAFYFLVVAGLLVADGVWVKPAAFLQTLRMPTVRAALVLSLWTSALTVVLSLIIAVPAGYVLSRWRHPLVRIVDTVVDLPIVLPPLVVGLSLLILFTRPAARWLGQYVVFQPAGIVAAQFVVACAFGIRTMKATFDGIDPRYESVVRTLGFSPLGAFCRGTLPLARNGAVAAGVLVWARAIGEFGPVLVLCGATHFHTETLSTAIYLEWSIGNLDGALAISLMMIVLAMIVLILFKALGAKAYLA